MGAVLCSNTCNLVVLNCNFFQVRAYAVSVLERADDEELQCYLLQLVQALRFERSDTSRLCQFLIQRCMLACCSFVIYMKFLYRLMYSL